MAKICEISDVVIRFDDGSCITYDHRKDCCEDNYADFSQIEGYALDFDFDTENMKFKAVDEAGFRFGNPPMMFFVPCYSEQNGYYSDDIDIYWGGEHVLNFVCEDRIY